MNFTSWAKWQLFRQKMFLGEKLNDSSWIFVSCSSLQQQHFFLAWDKSCDPTVNWSILDEIYRPPNWQFFFKNRQYNWLIFIFLGWLGYASGSLFFKASTSTVDFNLIKIDDLNVEKVVVSSNETTLSRPGKFTQYSWISLIFIYLF